MNSSEVKKRLSILRKECEDKKHERKVLATDYERQKEMVKKSGIICIVSFLIQYVILVPFSDNTKHVTLAGMARFLGPFLTIIFLGSFIYMLIKGFDFFINADTKYSRKLAEKFNVQSVSEELKLMNDTITMLDVEIDRIEKELFDSGESFANEFNDVSVKIPVKMSAGKMLDREVVKRTIIEVPKAEVKSYEKLEADDAAEEISDLDSDFDSSVKTKRTHEIKSDIDDILSGLDDFVLEDDDDETESSSELWEKDAMRRFSKY